MISHRREGARNMPDGKQQTSDLAAKVDRVPGLEGLGTFLATMGVLTFDQLGEMTDQNWQKILAYLPTKRLDVPQDLMDPSRLGPGHINALDRLHKQAQDAAEAQVHAHGDGSRESADVQDPFDIAAAHTNLEPRAIGAPSFAELTQATAEAEAKAANLLLEAEKAVGTENLPTSQILALMKDLLAIIGEGTAESAETLGLTNYILAKCHPVPHQRVIIEALERKCRDVLVWRCQLLSFQQYLGPSAVRRRDYFIQTLIDAVGIARDTVAAYAAEAETGADGDCGGSKDLIVRTVGLSFLQSAASNWPQANDSLAWKFVSQALHANRAEVAKRFPETFFSNCQRTAARRVRARLLRQRLQATEAMDHGANAEDSDEEKMSWKNAVPHTEMAPREYEVPIPWSGETWSCENQGEWEREWNWHKYCDWQEISTWQHQVLWGAGGNWLDAAPCRSTPENWEVDSEFNNHALVGWSLSASADSRRAEPNGFDLEPPPGLLPPWSFRDDTFHNHDLKKKVTSKNKIPHRAPPTHSASSSYIPYLNLDQQVPVRVKGKLPVKGLKDIPKTSMAVPETGAIGIVTPPREVYRSPPGR